ncbi:hypothetical protein EVAR_87271_1 [Eumeta japonica]|uniref:Nucleic-acid-binding protein from transposon X-element n=1 Tax=Eumeta variegata TaxID=151549 RepID=A0A4C1VX07_EUMVA|nr:hypothetical protein EVAR_87271_1 [Eumeta japonica]
MSRLRVPTVLHHLSSLKPLRFKDQLPPPWLPRAPHQIFGRDGSPLDLVLAILSKVNEAKLIFRNLYKVCGLSGIRVKTRECPRTRESEGKPLCVNCGQDHTGNYRECPKKPKFISTSTNRTNKSRSSLTPPSLDHDERNYPALVTKNSARTLLGRDERTNGRRPKYCIQYFGLRSYPLLTCGGNNQPPRVAQEPSREATHRGPLAPPPAPAVTGPAASFGEDIKTIMFTHTLRIGVEIGNNAREAPAFSNYRMFCADVLELIRAKNVDLRRASAYPTAEYKSRARPTRVIRGLYRSASCKTQKTLFCSTSIGPLMSWVNAFVPEG